MVSYSIMGAPIVEFSQLFTGLLSRGLQVRVLPGSPFFSKENGLAVFSESLWPNWRTSFKSSILLKISALLVSNLPTLVQRQTSLDHLRQKL